MSEDSVTKRLEKYKEGIKDNFTVLIEKTFPEKILELTDLLESDKFSFQRLESIHVSKRLLLSIEWKSTRLGGPAYGIETKTVHKTLPGGDRGVGGLGGLAGMGGRWGV